MTTPEHDVGCTSRSGFTLAEILVALVFLTLVAVSFGATSQHASRIVSRSRMELAAKQFLEVEVERLRLLDYDSLENGTRTRGRGIASWQVEDSTSFSQIVLETRFGTPATGMIVDSVTLFRTP